MKKDEAKRFAGLNPSNKKGTDWVMLLWVVVFILFFMWLEGQC